MPFVGWSIDIAREQSPTDEWLDATFERSRAAGYNAVGLYLEHRLSYPSAPWAAGAGCLTPERARALALRFKDRGLRVIPFLNTLGHMEGFIRAEGGQWLAEGPGVGSLQICPSTRECVDFARGLVSDAMAAFDDEWVHLGGDETRQLGQCVSCRLKAERVGLGGLYGEYFGDLCRWLLKRGRRPCLWGDMLIKYPEAMGEIPRQTIIFDWQYFSRPRETTQMFRRRGYDVVCCPSVQTYASGWCFLNATRTNIDEHAADARELDALGVLVTTWEFSYFTHYAGAMPVILAAGRRVANGQDWNDALIAEGGAEYARAAELLGNQIPAASKFLREGTWRKLRECFVIRQNPFLLWQHWREDACGEGGSRVLRMCDEAAAGMSSDSELQFPILLHRVAVEWVRLVERAYRHYAERRLAACVAELEAGPELLSRLRPDLVRVAAGGGSSADVARLDLLIRKVDVVQRRVQELPVDSAFLPAFSVLTHDGYVGNDQAAWKAADPPEPLRPG